MTHVRARRFTAIPAHGFARALAASDVGRLVSGGYRDPQREDRDGIGNNCSVVAARVTLKASTMNCSGSGTMSGWKRTSEYFYFFGGEASDWIDRTVPGTTPASYELLRRLKRRTAPPISMNAKVAGSGTSSIVKACC